jgi:hypothetical protein
VLWGGGGPNVLVGGTGNNVLWGGKGRNLMIGGSGKCSLVGGQGDSILIGGSTSFDANDQALMAILREWCRTDVGYRVRVDHLTRTTGGLNTLNGIGLWLNAKTIHKGKAGTLLTSGPAADLFFQGIGTSVGRKTRNETVVPVIW